jgi:hypothetical protein
MMLSIVRSSESTGFRDFVQFVTCGVVSPLLVGAIGLLHGCKHGLEGCHELLHRKVQPLQSLIQVERSVLPFDLGRLRFRPLLNFVGEEGFQHIGEKTADRPLMTRLLQTWPLNNLRS